MKKSSDDGQEVSLGGKNYTLLALALLGFLLVWNPNYHELKTKLVDAASLMSLGVAVVALIRSELR